MSFLQKIEAATYSRKLYPEVKNPERFTQLAQDQRGDAEEFMVQAARFNPGMYSWCLEHVGDLIHRMTEAMKYNAGGREYVLEKTQKTLKEISNPTFIRQCESDLQNNARHDGIEVGKFRGQWQLLLNAYTRAHRALKPFNELQLLAKTAAVSLGEGDFEKTKRVLRRLLQIAKVSKVYEEKVREEP